jgi:hypothetical protein
MHTINPGNQPETEAPVEPGIVPGDSNTPVPDEERPEGWRDPNEPDPPKTEPPDQGTVQPVKV